MKTLIQATFLLCLGAAIAAPANAQWRPGGGGFGDNCYEENRTVTYRSRERTDSGRYIFRLLSDVSERRAQEAGLRYSDRRQAWVGDSRRVEIRRSRRELEDICGPRR